MGSYAPARTKEGTGDTTGSLKVDEVAGTGHSEQSALVTISRVRPGSAMAATSAASPSPALSAQSTDICIPSAAAVAKATPRQDERGHDRGVARGQAVEDRRQRRDERRVVERVEQAGHGIVAGDHPVLRAGAAPEVHVDLDRRRVVPLADGVDRGGDVGMGGVARRIRGAPVGQLLEPPLGAGRLRGEAATGHVVDGVEDDRAQVLGRRPHGGQAQAGAVADAEEVPTVVAQRSADLVEVAHAGLGVVVAEVDARGLQPAPARRQAVDDGRPLDREGRVALQVGLPGRVPLRALQRRLGPARPPLVVEHDVARGSQRRGAVVLGRAEPVEARTAGGHHDGVGLPCRAGGRQDGHRERDGGTVGL